MCYPAGVLPCRRSMCRSRLTRSPRSVMPYRKKAKSIPSTDDFFADFGFLDKKSKDGPDSGKRDNDAPATAAGQTPTETGAPPKPLPQVGLATRSASRDPPHARPSRPSRLVAACSLTCLPCCPRIRWLRSSDSVIPPLLASCTVWGIRRFPPRHQARPLAVLGNTRGQARSGGGGSGRERRRGGVRRPEAQTVAAAAAGAGAAAGASPLPGTRTGRHGRGGGRRQFCPPDPLAPTASLPRGRRGKCERRRWFWGWSDRKRRRRRVDSRGEGPGGGEQGGVYEKRRV